MVRRKCDDILVSAQIEKELAFCVHVPPGATSKAQTLDNVVNSEIQKAIHRDHDPTSQSVFRFFVKCEIALLIFPLALF